MEFSQSKHALIEELNLFTIPPTQNSVKRVHFVEYRPVNGVIRNSPIDIVIPGSGYRSTRNDLISKQGRNQPNNSVLWR